MSAQHTQGRLTVNPLYPIQIATSENPIRLVALSVVGHPYTEQEAVDIARRLVACWNACEGLPTELIERRGVTRSGIASGTEEIAAQRDELLAALEKIYDAYCIVMRGEFDFTGRPWTPERDDDEAAIYARDTIAKVKGGAA